MNLAVKGPGGELNLQATLSLASATNGPNDTVVAPHHPITCASGELRYEEDGTFACGHAEVPPDDRRTQSCLDHTIALLLLELVAEL